MHPNEVLIGAQAGAVFLPACDHYCGVPARMEKSLALQRELMAELGVCPLDVTLDCEDGAPVGHEAEHAALVAKIVFQAVDSARAAITNIAKPRIAVRVHAVNHPAFGSDVATIVGQVGAHLCHVMLPKVESVADVETAVAAIDAAGGGHLPLHALIESPLAVHHAFEIAAHPRVASLSFGLMDFVSSHGGAIDASAMGLEGQFAHPLVRRAKLEMAAACHAHGKVPSHCVVTEFSDPSAIERAAHQARELGYTRMWSIHPAQIRPILAAFAPPAHELAEATALLKAAQAAHWAPISFAQKLHDRASYRYYWHLLLRARASGAPLPPEALHWFGNNNNTPPTETT